MRIIECRLVIIIDVAVHQVHHTLQRLRVVCQQMLLHHAHIIKVVYLVRRLYPTKGLIFPAKFTQHDGLQGASLVVVAVADKTTLQLVQRVLPALLLRADAGCLIVAGIGPRLVPRGLPEAAVGLVHLPQHLTDDTQVKQRLTVVGVGVAFLLHLDGSLQIALSLLETGPAQIPQAHLHITAIVQRIATQRLLIIVEGTPCGVTILLQVQTCKIQLVHGLRVLWRQGGLSSVRYRTYLVWLSMPFQQGQHPGMLCAVNDQRQLL